MIDALPAPHIDPQTAGNTPAASTSAIAEMVWLIPVLLALLALAVRLAGLGDKPLWYDEVLTFERASLPFADRIADSFANKHYPTWFALSAPFTGGGLDATLLRLPAAVFGALWVGILSAIALSLGGRIAALTAGLLAVFSPIDVQYAQEARSYTLTATAILVSMWGLLRLTETPDAMAATGANAPRTAWLAYTFGAALALYTLSVATVWFLAANVAVAVTAQRPEWRLSGVRGPWLRNWMLANGAVLLAWLPGVSTLALANVESGLDGLTWIPTPDLALLFDVVSFVYLYRAADMMSGELFPAAIPGFGLAVAALVALGLWRGRRSLVLAIALFAMPAIMLAVSLVQPLIVPRYLLWSTGPWFILAGLGAAALPRFIAPAAVAALAILAFVSLLPYYGAETKPPWNLAAAHLAAHAGENDRVITASSIARRVMTAHLREQAPEKVAVTTFETEDTLRRRFEDGHTIWIFHGRDSQAPVPPRDAFLALWTPLFGAPVATATFGKGITLWRFEKR